MKHYIKNDSLAAWRNALKAEGVISSNEAMKYEDIDQRKTERLKKLNRRIGLPVDLYRNFSKHEWSKNKKRILEGIRCINSDQFSLRVMGRGWHERFHEIASERVTQLIDKYDKRKGPITFRLSEYFAPTVSGHILVEERGVLIEAVEGKLMNLSQQWKDNSNIVQGSFMFPNAGFRYSTDQKWIREILWEAFKKLLWNRRTYDSYRRYEIALGYYEFVFHRQYGFRFVDFNDSGFGMRFFGAEVPRLCSIVPMQI